jgi:hypothetical protein
VDQLVDPPVDRRVGLVDPRVDPMSGPTSDPRVDLMSGPTSGPTSPPSARYLHRTVPDEWTYYRLSSVCDGPKNTRRYAPAFCYRHTRDSLSMRIDPTTARPVHEARKTGTLG